MIISSSEHSQPDPVVQASSNNNFEVKWLRFAWRNRVALLFPSAALPALPAASALGRTVSRSFVVVVWNTEGELEPDDVVVGDCKWLLTPSWVEDGDNKLFDWPLSVPVDRLAFAVFVVVGLVSWALSPPPGPLYGDWYCRAYRVYRGWSSQTFDCRSLCVGFKSKFKSAAIFSVNVVNRFWHVFFNWSNGFDWCSASLPENADEWLELGEYVLALSTWISTKSTSSSFSVKTKRNLIKFSVKTAFERLA